jgi:hypothetical protein
MLVRHGESQANVVSDISRTTDPRLTDAMLTEPGVEQVCFALPKHMMCVTSITNLTTSMHHEHHQHDHYHSHHSCACLSMIFISARTAICTLFVVLIGTGDGTAAG